MEAEPEPEAARRRLHEKLVALGVLAVTGTVFFTVLWWVGDGGPGRREAIERKLEMTNAATRIWRQMRDERRWPEPGNPEVIDDRLVDVVIHPAPAPGTAQALADEWAPRLSADLNRQVHVRIVENEGQTVPVAESTADRGVLAPR